MEIKVGQWKRRDNQFYSIIELSKDKTKILVEYKLITGKKARMWKSIYWWDITPEYFTYVNTPQELIQANDLVEYMYGIRKVYNVTRNKITVGANKYIYTNDITKILTPNSNGGFDLQWEAE